MNLFRFLRIVALHLAWISTSVYAQSAADAPFKFSTLVKDVKIEDQMPFSKAALFACGEKTCSQTFYSVPLQRSNVTMNSVVLSTDAKPKVALFIIPGTDGPDGRIHIKGLLAPKFGVMQYLYENADLFLNQGIALVATGCPTDQLQQFGDCTDSYRKSMQYAEDFKQLMAVMKEKHGFEKFYIFGHSSGGISTRWLSVNLHQEFAGVINSSIMNGTAMNLAHSTVGFDMTRIKAPVLNIAHENDQCPSTPYFVVKNYSHGNLITVRGGGTSGFVCGEANHHSFEGRQRGVSKAIVKWMTTGEVQAVVDSDE